VARVKAVLRRSRAAAGPAAEAPLQIDAQGWRAWWRGHPLDLTPNEIRLLHALSSQPGRVYARAQLLDLLHGDGRAVTERAVDSHVKNLRRKLDQAGAGSERIRSVYGVGYSYDD
jgi:two-component system, OmpR family, response regulator BaeR